MQKPSDDRVSKTEMTQEEIEQFREFFTTSVAQVPEEMTGRIPERSPKISGGLFQRLFHKKEEDSAAGGSTGELTLPTGEVLLDGAQEDVGEVVLEPVDETGELRLDEPEQTPDGGLTLEPVEEPETAPAADEPEREDASAAEKAAAEAEQARAARLALERELGALSAPADGADAKEAPEDSAESLPEPEAAAESAPAVSSSPAAPQPRPAAPARAAIPEDEGLLELKELLEAVREGRPIGAARPAARPEPEQPTDPSPETAAETVPPPEAEPAPQPEEAAAPQAKLPDVQPFFAEIGEPEPEPPQPAAPPQELPEETAERPEQEAPPAGDTIEFPAVPEKPAAPQEPETEPELSKKDRWDHLFQMFGAGEDEAAPPPSGTEGQKEDTLSLPLLAVEEEPAAQAADGTETPVQAESAPESAKTDSPAQPADSAEEAPQDSEEIGENLKHMSARMTLRCALSGILAAALLGLGLMAEGLLPASGALDPVGAPAAFMGANLLLLLVAGGVSFGILREGLAGLFGRPSADSLPAVATAAALVQALAALLNAETYSVSGLTLMSGMAALSLFMANLGTRIRLSAVQGNYDLIACGVEHSGAYRVRDRDLVRCLAEGLGEKDPWILLSRPVDWTSNFIEQSFSERTSERLARRMARILAVAGVLCGLVTLIFGGGMARAASALATVVCLGAPLSSTLIAGLSSLRMQRTAGAVGAVIPGWAAVEELGGIDTVQVDARDLFTPECAQLEDIRLFKGGRIDKDILYAASVLSQGCNTLSGLFRQIIADRTDILLPVKDLEKRRGLGFAAWCDNCRVLVGTRAMMEQEGVALPEQEYEDTHSQNGALQVLYLAVSGDLHAMFLLKYVGGRHAARGLAVLQHENVRLLVSCDDPTLTAQRINEVYRLPEGLVRVMTEEQCQAVAPAVAYASDAPCCMVHLQGFASLTGGLRAAARAQTAEQSGTTVQLVSVCISVAIGLLLTYAGTVGTLSLAAVLMYQAAWSALSMALAVLKQH